MALKSGRIGYLGIGIEAIAGTPVAATSAVPFIDNSLLGKHEYIGDISARGSRAIDAGSVIGKRWSEGDLTINVDTLNSGFLLKLSTGNEIVNTVTTGVYDHLFYTTVSGNAPLTATMYNYRGVDTEAFSSVTVDKLSIEVKDGLMTAKTALKGFYPTSGSYANTTVSGTLLAFNSYTLKMGNTLVAAAAAAATPLTDFSLTVDNQAEVIHESGNPNASRVFWKGQKVTGAFTRFFESVTERNNYYNLNKQSLVMTASGNALIGGYAEALTINLAKCAWNDAEITTGIDDFFAIKTTFTAEVDYIQGKQFDITLRNYKSTVYA